MKTVSVLWVSGKRGEGEILVQQRLAGSWCLGTGPRWGRPALALGISTNKCTNSSSCSQNLQEPLSGCLALTDTGAFNVQTVHYKSFTWVQI